LSEQKVLKSLPFCDLFHLKLVNKEWAAKISKWLEKGIRYYMREAMCTPVEKAAYIKLTHSLIGV
jgi:hypothetical protein